MQALSGNSLLTFLSAMIDKMHYLKVLFDDEEYEVYMGYGDWVIELREVYHPQLGDPAMCKKLRQLIRDLVHPDIDILIMNKYTTDEPKSWAEQHEIRDELWNRLIDLGEEEAKIVDDWTISGQDTRDMERLRRLCPGQRFAEEAIRELIELAEKCRVDREAELRKETYEKRRDLARVIRARAERHS